jgi:hypothetical protein
MKDTRKKSTKIRREVTGKKSTKRRREIFHGSAWEKTKLTYLD